MRVVVTGGAGFIGSHVVDRLVERGDDVVVVDDLSNGRPANLPPTVRLVEQDISAPDTARTVADLRPELIVHAAAQASVAVSTSSPVRDAEVNVVGTLRVLEAARAAATRRFVYVNTGGALYGDVDHPCREDEPISPISPYGLSKWTAERYLDTFTPPGMTLAVLRLANVYGPRQRDDGEAGVVSIFLSRMLDGAPIEIHGDGEQTRDFVYVGDVADAIVRAAEIDRRVIVNLGTGRAVSINELFASMARLTGHAAAPIHTARRSGDVRHSVLDVAAARRELGWSPRIGLEEGLRRTLASREAATPPSVA